MTREQEHEQTQRAQAGAFKIVDRRRFTAAGELRPDAPADTPRPARTVPPAQSAPAAQPSPDARQSAPPRQQAAATMQSEGASAPKTPAPRGSASSIDFLTFISSLATNAMAAMGLLPPSQGRAMPQNLNMAREYLEIIVMLHERTAGNLSPDEDSAMAQLIDDLGKQLVALQRAGAPVNPLA